LSIKVKIRLDALNILTTHEERMEIDRLLEERMSMYCDDAVGLLNDEEFRKLVDEAKKRIPKKRREEVVVYG